MCIKKLEGTRIGTTADRIGQFYSAHHSSMLRAHISRYNATAEQVPPYPLALAAPPFP